MATHGITLTDQIKKIEVLKQENDQANTLLQNIDAKKSQIIQEILIRNGRILALEEIVKELG